MEKCRNVIVAFGIISLAIPFKTVCAEEATLVGSDACVACHSDKAESFKKSLHGKKLPIVKKVGFDKACESCHGAGSLHAAAAGDKNNPGFSTIKKLSGLESKDLSKVCFTCHKQKEIIMWDTSSHAQSGLTCARCHSVHEGQGPTQLKKGSTETCLDCHSKLKAETKLPSHHPLLEGKMNCSSCHNPHGGVEGNLKTESVEETCFKCHAEKAGPFAHEHPPVTESCAICHKPHGSANEALLKQPQPFLCMRCHKWPHTNSTNNAQAFDISKIQDRQRCTDCHREIHGSDRHAAFKN